jgi:AraC-like DNA-binding protein
LLTFESLFLWPLFQIHFGGNLRYYLHPDLSANDIAREFAMSRASLYAKVKDSFSSGIGEYIEEKRIQEAKRLLKETTLSVTEISERTGYSSQRYFSTRFKKCTNRSPLSYRKNK